MKLRKSKSIVRGVLDANSGVIAYDNDINKNSDRSEKSIRTESTCSSQESLELDRGVRDALFDDISIDDDSERSREFRTERKTDQELINEAGVHVRNGRTLAACRCLRKVRNQASLTKHHKEILERGSYADRMYFVGGNKTTTPDPSPPPPLPKDVVDEILASPAPYADEKQRATCRRMVDELSPEDQEIAARTSYAYWVAANFHEEPPSDEIRIRMAMREARRHLVLKLGKYGNGLSSFRGAIQFRKEYNVDLLRTCFPRCSLKTDTPEIEKKRELYRSYLLHEFKLQKNVVRGQDRGGRAVALRFQRTAPTAMTNPEAFAAVLYYMTERALACTEYMSRGREEKVCALTDFDEFNFSNSPPMKCMKNAATVAQSVYPARLQTLIIVMPNFPVFAIKSIFFFIRPLLSASTLSKLAMACGKEKDETVGKYVAPGNAMPFMLANGELDTEIDMDHYLNSVPFHCKYDDVVCKRR